MTSCEEATGPGIRGWVLRHRSPRQRIAFAGPGVGVGRFSLSQQLVTDASVLMYRKTSSARSSASAAGPSCATAREAAAASRRPPKRSARAERRS